MNKRKQPIEVVPYNSDWIKDFESESRRIKSIFGDNVVAIHHVGSTAVPGLAANLQSISL